MGVRAICCDEPLNGGDHFVARFLVGSALSGAPAPDQTGYFRWIRDPGDATGIATAIAEMTALGIACDLCIQEGTYTRAPGLARFVVPTGCRVWSPGGAQIRSNNADDCIWQLTPGCTLERIACVHAGALVGVGTALVEVASGVRTRVIDCVLQTDVQVIGVDVSGGATEIGGCDFYFTGLAQNAPVGLRVEGALLNPASFDAHDNYFELFNKAITFGAASSVRDSRIVSNRMTLANGIVPIAAGAQSSRSTAALNVSRGSGSTLPTDAGTFNSINPGVSNIWGP